jgi:hypothetical protein
MPTFADLIHKTLVELRQEPGISVQQYSEDVIAAILQRQFNIFFDHYWWPRYTTNRAQFTLNGVDGRVTTDLREKIRRADDIRNIWYQSENTPLPAFPAHVNGGNYRMYYDTVPDSQIFKIVPENTTGYVTVSYRTKPKPFMPNDEVFLDEDLLVCATCFNYLADDEDAPNSVKKFQEATAKREAQLREAMNRGPIPFGAPAMSPFTSWMTN